MGLLRISGSIALEQFWPQGESDADTTKVKVDVKRGSFSYAPDGKTFRVTHVFDDAKVLGKTRENVIRNGQVVVRLQGIDAPELHYRAGPLQRSQEISEQERKRFNDLNKVPRRQYWAETATLALREKLGNYGGDTVQCEVLSFIDHPHELVDTYGRVVADIRVGKSFGTDVNTWLVEEGWAVPTFYSSMSSDEIERLLAAQKKGKPKHRALSAITDDTSHFDEKLVYRRHAEPDPNADQGPVLMPKLFRRQVAYKLQSKAGIVSGAFKKFLAASPDYCFELDDFLEQTVHSATPHTLDEFLDGSTMTRGPHELVFKEKFSSVVGPDGKRLETF